MTYKYYNMLLKDTRALEAEVTLLESRLQDARAQLAASEYPSPPSSYAVKGKTTIYISPPMPCTHELTTPSTIYYR
jgi:hypothetical protein